MIQTKIILTFSLKLCGFNTSEQFIMQVENQVRKTTEITSKSLRMESPTRAQLKASSRAQTSVQPRGSFIRRLK